MSMLLVYFSVIFRIPVSDCWYIADITGQTAVYVAATTGHTEMIHLLLSRGANIDAIGVFSSCLEPHFLTTQ
jgi:hypothetical protein